MRLYCDNKSTISIVYDPVQHDRTKHVGIDRPFIKEKLESEFELCPLYFYKQSTRKCSHKGIEWLSVSCHSRQVGNG